MNTTAVRQTVGPAIAEWDEDTPLRWTMREPARKGGLAPDPIDCDLSSLRSGYGMDFLLACKDALIALRHRVQLVTIKLHSVQLRLLLEQVHATAFNRGNHLTRIDGAFLVALAVMVEKIPASYLKTLRSLHRIRRDDSRLFEPTLQPGDFPTRTSKRGTRGDRIHQILSKALSRSTLVHILDVVEAAFEEKRIDLGRYAFVRLALNIFCRPNSYRQLTLTDLRIDTNPHTGAVTYFLDVPPAKTRVHNPKKIRYRVHPEVGRLLALQRQSVVEQFGHLAVMTEGGPAHGQLALFPSRSLHPDRSSWTSPFANSHGGMLQRGSFQIAYLKPIRTLACNQLSFVALRHTIATQLAQMGCSAHTIQGVLKHASDATCQAYVDIVFAGLIDKLSDGLEPAFAEHFPVYTVFASKADAIPIERRIVSEDLETGRVETTAVCGRQVACEYAPIACYSCPRFIPCYDADHSINLEVVTRDICALEGGGLAMQHDVKRWKTVRNRIRLVIAACEVKRNAVAVGIAEGRGTSE